MVGVKRDILHGKHGIPVHAGLSVLHRHAPPQYRVTPELLQDVEFQRVQLLHRERRRALSAVDFGFQFLTECPRLRFPFLLRYGREKRVNFGNPALFRVGMVFARLEKLQGKVKLVFRELPEPPANQHEQITAFPDVVVKLVLTRFVPDTPAFVLAHAPVQRDAPTPVNNPVQMFDESPQFLALVGELLHRRRQGNHNSALGTFHSRASRSTTFGAILPYGGGNCKRGEKSQGFSLQTARHWI